MVLRDIYNVVGDAAQDTFFSEDYSTYEVINAKHGSSLPLLWSR